LAKDSVFTAECKLVKIEPIGDHTMFIGEVVAMEEGTSDDPILYSKKKYWKVGSEVEKPSEEERERFKEVIARHQKNEVSE
ncbi:flavin reductase family protein, partial [Candidatus Woesebacteria bacterium]|nr:flavin reductase family protein [Candidatus Woesebacteria bacterium]